jgi:REP element-mobilizing transposase RayT
MTGPETNPGLDRVRHELRANGLSPDAPNPLHSGIHTRGYLPHVKREGASYFVTFRLADSLPREVLLELKRHQAEKLLAIGTGKPAARETIQRDFQRQVERYLDRGVGECHLKRPDVAQMVVESLLHFHEQQYVLDEWVIMPNHVHVVLWPLPNHTLSEILRSRKRHTARQANLMLGRTGMTFWQQESFDHWIRNDEEKSRIRRYIRNNPVTAGLCRSPEDWRWSSAYFCKLQASGLPIRDTADCQSALRRGGASKLANGGAKP